MSSSSLRYEPAGPGAVRVIAPDGTSSLQEVFEYDGARIDWCSALGLPHVEDILTDPAQGAKLEAMTWPRALGRRGFECVVLDESPTRFKTAWHHQVRKVGFPQACNLTLSHFPVETVIGIVTFFRVVDAADVEGVDGAGLLGSAILFGSPLADRAWIGLVRGLFPAVCAVVHDPFGNASLMEVALTDISAVPGAQIISLWEARPDGRVVITRLQGEPR